MLFIQTVYISRWLGTSSLRLQFEWVNESCNKGYYSIWFCFSYNDSSVTRYIFGCIECSLGLFTQNLHRALSHLKGVGHIGKMANYIQISCHIICLAFIPLCPLSTHTFPPSVFIFLSPLLLFTSSFSVIGKSLFYPRLMYCAAFKYVGTHLIYMCELAHSVRLCSSNFWGLFSGWNKSFPTIFCSNARWVSIV